MILLKTRISLFMLMAMTLLIVACAPPEPEGSAVEITQEPVVEPTDDVSEPQESITENQLAGTSWQLMTMDGAEVMDGMTLEFTDDAISGVDGCNNFSGGYTLSDGTLSIGEEIATTLMACPDVDAAMSAQYLAALSSANTFTLEDDTLTIQTTEGELVFATPTEMEATNITNTTWTLVNTIVGGDAVVPAPFNSSAHFMIDGEKVSGNTGCNNLNTTVMIDGTNISFGNVATTRMMCPDEKMQTETAMLDTLGNAATFAVDGNQLTLLNADGLPIATFAAAEEKTLYIGAETAECVGVGPQTCLLVKENVDDEYTFFYDTIAGFEYEEGFEYELLVSVSERQDVPMDASTLQYTLVEVVSKTAVDGVDGSEDSGLVGTVWQWVRFEDTAGINDIEVDNPASFTIEFMADGTYAMQVDCNRGGGAYSAENQSLTINPGFTTEAFCGEESLDTDFLNLLGDVVTFVFDDDGNLVMNLMVDAGNMVFTPAQ